MNKSDEDKIITIRIPNTPYWVRGEQEDGLWKIYVTNPKTNYKNLIRENITTKAFTIFSNVILKTPFPYEGAEEK
jgi:hypothetical protein